MWYKKGLLFSSLIIFGILLSLNGCAGPAKSPETTITANINENEEDNAVWGKYYPRQYESWLKNKEQSKTWYSGSVRESHLDKKPYLRIIYQGYPFGEDYNEERGHVYALDDVKQTKRINKKSVASCLNCKTPTAPKMVAKQGISWYKKPFNEALKDVKHNIGCWDCHDPKTMALRVTRQNMINAFKRQGKDVNASPRNEMRTYVCAQCHNEYYFKKDSKEVTNPWDNGLSPQDIVKYYDKINFSDWDHAVSGTKMIKMQHPEYEMADGSVHQSAGVSCSDCHMPYIREGVEKFSSHWMTSPLKNIEVSCQPCHRQTVDWLKSRIKSVQDKTNSLLNTAGQENVRAIRAIAEAAKVSGVNTARLDEARKYHRTSQAYWDWVHSDNSMGFHDPEQVLQVLGLSINNARQAQVLAAEAAGKSINPPITDIPKIQVDKLWEPKQRGDKPKYPPQLKP